MKPGKYRTENASSKQVTGLKGARRVQNIGYKALALHLKYMYSDPSNCCHFYIDSTIIHHLVYKERAHTEVRTYIHISVYLLELTFVSLSATRKRTKLATRKL